MIHLIALTLFGIVLILAQGSLPALPVRPNLVVVIAIYSGQFYLPVPALIISFALGYFLDLISGGLLGLNAFSMVAVCYLAYSFSRRIAIENLVPQLMTVFSFYMVYGGTTYLLFQFFNFNVTNLSHLKATIFDGLTTTFLSIFVIFAIKKMERVFRFVNERAQGGPRDIRI